MFSPATMRLVGLGRRIPGRAKFAGAVLALAALIAVVALWVARSGSVRRRVRALERRADGRHARFADSIFADHFQRGNVHTHSLLSDGSSSMEAVAAWYRNLGYQFLAMTEHNLQLEASDVARFSTPGFVVIPGEEVTNHWGPHGGHPLHVNSLCAPHETPGGFDFAQPDEGLVATLEDVRLAGGIPLVNHPNFGWTLTADDVARGASGRYLFEIWSGHPNVNPDGDALRPSAESIWDDLLARGADAIPVAVDDAHNLPGDSSHGGNALPGRAWVETFGDETSVDAICTALARGDLYASNGPVIARIRVKDDVFAVATTDPGATVEFLGERGEVLSVQRAGDVPPREYLFEVAYRLSGGETLVRARMDDAVGRHAWTVAYRVTD
jgi:hypothetical protein